MTIRTPYYLIDEKKLLRNLRIIGRVRDRSGARSLLALKCFSTWSVFDLMRPYMDGTTSSSLFEARLGRQKFGKETHAYCVGYTGEELTAVKRYADTIIFNSVSQLKQFHKEVLGKRIGLRINPLFSYSRYDLADPARRYSRLGVPDKKSIHGVLPLLSGCMFHFNCENSDFTNFKASLDALEKKYGDIFERLDWISLGGGLAFTNNNYPIDRFCLLLKKFSDRFNIQVFLEPGEAAVTGSTELVTSVVDIVRNKTDIAIVNASVEAHALDHLIYRTSPKIDGAANGPNKYMVAGRSCLAGDVFGTYTFNKPLRTGSIIRIADAGGYTMVKKNWFNGLSMPSIVIRRRNGKTDPVRNFTYRDFVNSLS